MQDMIQFRELNIDHVKLAIREPDFTETTFQGRMKVRKELDDGRVLEVIYFREGFKDSNDHVVITAYYQD